MGAPRRRQLRVAGHLLTDLIERAAAENLRVVHSRQRTSDDAVTVVLPGGELLIEFDESGAWMTGPASIVFRGSVD